MRIDPQVPAHLDDEVLADLFLSILEGGEFFTEIQTAMASLSLVGDEFAGDLLPPGEPPDPALEFAPFTIPLLDISVRASRAESWDMGW